jgi:serine phosphatase RsbU (regulator of sigma subunit)
MSQEPVDSLETQTLKQRLSGLMKLVDVTCQLAGTADIDRVLEIVTTSACEALFCERASLFLYDEPQRELYTRMVTALEIEGIRSTIDRGITGWVARTRKVANVPDPYQDSRWNSAVDRETGFHTQSILAVPVASVASGQLVGVLELLNKQDGSFNDFDEQLLQAFASHAATALERAHLLESARRSRELEIDLEVARRIQHSFLPTRIPEVPGYEAAAWWQPAESVSGDYYDLVQLPDGRTGLLVADVSGHGVAASLIMAALRAMFHVLTRTLSEPDEILTLISNTITPDLENGRFITCLMVAVDPRTNQFTFANAGHAPAFHFDRATGAFRNLESTSFPIGLDRHAETPLGPTLQLKQGDLLLLATDGTVELRDPHGNMFGRNRLERLVAENRTLAASQLIKVLSRAIQNFHAGIHPPDDATLLLLERKLEP